MSSPTSLSRRRVLAAGGEAALATMLAGFASAARAAQEPLNTRALPHGGRAQLPAVGAGTAILFNFDNHPATYAERRLVIQTLIAGGGRLIDEAQSYSHARDRVAGFVAESRLQDTLLLATKFSCNTDCVPATALSQTSLRLPQTDRADLVQAWKPGDPDDDFVLLSVWENQGLWRYVGLTTSSNFQDVAIARVLARASPNFLGVHHSLGRRDSESMLLPTARNAGATVQVNLPLQRTTFSILSCAVLGAMQLTRAAGRSRGQKSLGWSLVATSLL